MIKFGDSAGGAQEIPFEYAALYSTDCDFPADKGIAEVKYDAHHTRWITFHGDVKASILDFEPGTRAYQEPSLVHEWLTRRYEQQIRRMPWIYCSLDNAARAVRQTEHVPSGFHRYPFQWFIATLNGVMRSQVELAELLHHFGVNAMPRQVAAQQWRNDDTYDSDICFVDGDW